MTSTWELSEFTSHSKALGFISEDISSAKSTADGIGGGDLWCYGLLVGPIASPIMMLVVDNFLDMLDGLKESVDATQQGIDDTYKLNAEAEANNAELTGEVTAELDASRVTVEGAL